MTGSDPADVGTAPPPSSPDNAAPDSDGESAPHPISFAIDTFVHRARDTKQAASIAIPAALKHQKRSTESLIKRIEAAKLKLESGNDADQIVGVREMNEANRRAERIVRSDVHRALEIGLYLSLFSAFDAFTGELLRALYQRKPALFSGLERQIPFSDLLKVKDLEELKKQIIADEIETIRRKSYVEQFALLSKRFDIGLTKFANWPRFVECSQRRNLLTHCDGIVNEQYLKVCLEAGVSTKELPALGEALHLGAEYFFTAAELLIEVGIKLGQTLWRKTLPEELELADAHIKETLYKALQWQTWKRAVTVGEFAVALPNVRKDIDRKVLLVNLAQAYRHSGAADKARATLATVDWTASAGDFQLAEAVLLADFDRAASLMLVIGKKGQMLTEQSYHEWPLFKDFRESNAFLDTYKAIYGRPFIQLAQKDAERVAEKAAIAVQKEATDDTAAPHADTQSGHTPA